MTSNVGKGKKVGLRRTSEEEVNGSKVKVHHSKRDIVKNINKSWWRAFPKSAKIKSMQGKNHKSMT